MKRLTLVVIFLLTLVITPVWSQTTSTTGAKADNKGLFANWIQHFCWRCIIPITVGKIEVPIGITMDQIKDMSKDNPAVPICVCTNGGFAIGVELGWWNPEYRKETCRKPFCFTSLGFCIPISISWSGGLSGMWQPDGSSRRESYVHVHEVADPAIRVIELVSDLPCMKGTRIDLLYVTEVDPTHNKPYMSLLTSPWAVLFANPIAQAICAIDCIASTVGLPLKFLFWCQGCQTVVYPFQSRNAKSLMHVDDALDGIQKVAAKLHLFTINKKTYGKDTICGEKIELIPNKGQYRFQMCGPRARTTGRCCDPYGATPWWWAPLRIYPIKGEDPRFITWKKRNCCIPVYKYGDPGGDDGSDPAGGGGAVDGGFE